MLTKSQHVKYADVLLWGLMTSREKRFRKNDMVMIQYDLMATQLAEILLGKLMDMGFNVLLRSGMTPVMEHTFYKKAGPGQLAFVAPGERERVSGLNGSLFLRAPESLTHLSDIDPKKIGKNIVSQKPLRDILRKREEEGLYGWTLCTVPTEELARQAKLTPKQYCSQVIRACYLDKTDPVRIWKDIYQDAMAIKTWINRMDIQRYHIQSANTDLMVTAGAHRKWIGLSGHNIPSFELFVSPDWRGTEGVYYADQPSFRSGNYVEGIRLFFKKGRAVGAQADRGEPFLRKQLSMDKGACRVGEFSLTDKRFSRIDRFMANTLYDENYGGRFGNCHLAVGSSFTATYDGDPAKLTPKGKDALGFNDSALHWDLVNTEDKTVTAYLKNGKSVVLYENGKFNHQ
jgi:aminopeptidase